MAGILSAIGTVLNLTEAVKTLGDEKMSDADKTRYLLERVHKGTLVQHSGDITKLLNVSKGKIFTMVCFDMTAILKKLFMEDNND